MQLTEMSVLPGGPGGPERKTNKISFKVNTVGAPVTIKTTTQQWRIFQVHLLNRFLQSYYTDLRML